MDLNVYRSSVSIDKLYTETGGSGNRPAAAGRTDN